MISDKKYQIIYADPPWQYEFSPTNCDAVEKHYPTMPLDEIKQLNIPSDDNAILFLWATAPQLLHALDVMKCWGFEYRTHLIWDKLTIGIGHWFRGQHELLLVGRKGEVHPPEQSKRISSVLRAKKHEHSSKPSIIRTLIGQWYPNLNKLELFARERIEGWDVWGNQVPNSKQLLLQTEELQYV